AVMTWRECSNEWCSLRSSGFNVQGCGLQVLTITLNRRSTLNFEPKRPRLRFSMKPKIVVILGPTAAGKSDVAMELALQMNGEIINADSQQVYRQMNIGTAKPSNKVREKIPHHVIDVVDPDEEFNVARYRELATTSIHDIRKRGKQAIVCGGTG